MKDVANNISAVSPANVAPTSNESAALDDIINRIALIWAEFLGAEDIEADDDFFQCGGSSLHRVLVATRVEEVFGIEFRPDTVLEDFVREPTVTRLARLVFVAVMRAGRE